MSRLTRFTLVAVFLLAGGVCLASAQKGTRDLTLRDAIDLALRHSPTVQAAQHQVDATAAQIPQARAGFLPTLDFTEAFTRADNPVFAFGAKLNQGRFTEEDFAVQRLNNPKPSNDFTTRLALTQPIFTGGKASSGLQQSQLRLRASTYGQRRQRQEVIFQVAATYYKVLRTRADLDVTRAAIRAAEANRKLAQDRFETGLVVASDVLSADVRLANLKEQNITARHQATLAKAALNDAMGLPLDRAFDVAEVLIRRPSRYPSLTGLDAQALGQRPDYQQLLTEAQVATQGVALARSAFLPTLGATASYDLHHKEFAREGQDSWFVGIALKWNLFNGLSDRAKVTESRANVSRLQALQRRMASQIKLEVQQAFLQLQAAGERIGVASVAVTQAEESLRLFRDRYEAGIATIVDLLTAESALTQARGNLTRSRYDHNVSLSALELALGSISPETF